MKRIGIFLITVMLAGLGATASGGEYGTITSVELKALIDKSEPGLVIIDSRSQSQYEENRIKGAVSLPLMDMEQNPALPDVPKDARLVFYCSGNT
jgi:rhodanese-related sulfurtransferase